MKIVIRLLIGVFLLIGAQQMNKDSKSTGDTAVNSKLILSLQISTADAEINKLDEQIESKNSEMSQFMKDSGLDAVFPKYPGHKLPPRIWDEHSADLEKYNALADDYNALVAKRDNLYGAYRDKVDRYNALYSSE
jgi:hypothetical protein